MPKQISKVCIGKARMKTTVSEKILVVERERIVAMDIDCILRGSGYSQTTIAYSFEEAMGKITSIRPDLVLIDDQIGDTGDGRNGGRKIIEEFNIPVLYLSSSSPVKNRARQYGTDYRLSFYGRPGKIEFGTSFIGGAGAPG